MSLPDIWRDVGKRIGFYTKETRNLIPEAPGCYAWFIPLWIYMDDLRSFVENLNRVLLYEPAAGGQDQLVAEFQWDAIGLQVQKLPNVHVSEARDADWRRIMGDKALREAFQQALMEASIFMPPLYLGKTDNLRVRYGQHVEGMGPGANVFHTRFTSFTQSLGLALTVSDLLFVCVLTDRDTDRTLREANLTELLEHVLMRVCKPPFSMR